MHQIRSLNCTQNLNDASLETQVMSRDLNAKTSAGNDTSET